jgi:hypothetical protein
MQTNLVRDGVAIRVRTIRQERDESLGEKI